jgi:UTP--glucose-1-phosphate uridylyltransferase
MIEVYEKTRRPVVAIRRVPREEVSSYGIIQGRPLGDGLWEVSDLVEKPHPDEAPSDLAVIGRYILPPEIFPVLEKLDPGRGGEIQLTDALRVLAQEEPIIGCEFQGIRYDVGTPKGLLVATIEMALSREDLSEELEQYLVQLVRKRDLL